MNARIPLSISLAMLPFAQRVQAKEPNIIFIMSDDHSRQTMSIYGHPIGQVAPTPNIDRIGREGAVFQRNFCCNSISGPSRATIITGKHSHKNGFKENWGYDFDGSQQTLPKILQANGYETAIIGKWHLVSLPTGFDHWMILDDQGDYYNPAFITPGDGVMADTTRHKGYVTDLITRYTKDWIASRENPEKPFFLMMHHKAIHRNWLPEPKYMQRYENTVFPVPDNFFDDYEGRIPAQSQEMNIYRHMEPGYDLKMTIAYDNDTLVPSPWENAFTYCMTPEERQFMTEAYRDRNNYYHTANMTPEEEAVWKYQRYMQDYMGCVASVDDSVGEILDYLEETGLADNTIVIYTTDQGFYMGEHGWFDKRFMYEESFDMPMVMRWPGHIEPGTQVTGLTQNIDFAPTFLDICGIEIPEDMQGISFRKLVEDGKTPEDWRKSLYYHYYEYPGFHMVKKHYGVRTDRYKLMHFYEDDIWELYDLETDSQEMHNIYGQAGTETLTEELKAEILRLQRLYDVPEEYTRPAQ